MPPQIALSLCLDTPIFEQGTYQILDLFQIRFLIRRVGAVVVYNGNLASRYIFPIFRIDFAGLLYMIRAL